MGFFPDNQKRAARLQQLVDSTANLQTAVIDISTKMDKLNAQYRPTIDALLHANNMASVDDLIAQAASQMTPQDRTVFESLISTARASKSGFDVTYLIGGLLMAPEGVALAGPQAIALARWGARMINIKNMGNFCKAAQSGSAAAAEAASKISNEAKEAEQTLEEAGDAGEAGEEAARAATMASRIGTFFKVLGAVGLVVSLIAGVIELVEGAEQKKKLIDAIHGLQPARLTTAYINQEGNSILGNLDSLDDYFSMMPGGDEPDPAEAANEAKRIVKRIQAANKAIDLGGLEDDLEKEDRSSTLFYGGDDLTRDQVIAAAQAKN